MWGVLEVQPPAQAESPHASQGLENAYEEALGAPSSVQPYPEKEAAIPMFPAASQESLPSMADTPSCGGLELKPLGAYGNLATVKKAMKAAVTCFLNMQLRAMGSAPHQQVRILFCWLLCNRWYSRASKPCLAA